MKIEMLFPEICNLYGDTMNMKYLALSMENAELISTPLKKEPRFITEKMDLIYMGPMTESSQELAINALMPYKEEIARLIDGGQAFFITGNAMELFGEYIENEDGSKIECLGIFGTHAKRQMMNRFNGLYLGKIADIEVVGFKSQFSHCYGSSGAAPLFETIRGRGMSRDGEAEGIRKNNFMATYVLGPLLPLNPLLVKYIKGLLGDMSGNVRYEEAAMQAYALRLAEFKDEKTGFSY